MTEKKRATKETAYETRRAIALSLVGQQLPIRQFVEEEGKRRQLPLTQQTVKVDGLGTFRVLLTPEGSVWEEDTPIRLIDEREEFVLWLGWQTTDSGLWPQNTVLKVEELNGKNLDEYRQDTLEAWAERKKQKAQEKAEFLEGVRAR